MFSQFETVKILINRPWNINVTWISEVDWPGVGSFHETDKAIDLSQQNLAYQILIATQCKRYVHTLWDIYQIRDIAETASLCSWRLDRQGFTTKTHQR